tara:strand:+ start:16334 stop:16804 length:471 start_codon:yes stop_codon:yes gene_type:complete
MIIRKKVDALLEIILSILLLIMVSNVVWQIASRYLFHDPSALTDELARYLFIWIGLLGAAYASGKGMHVSIDLLKRKLNENQIKIQNLIIQFIIGIFALLVMITGGIRLVYISFHLGQTSSAMQLSLGYIYLVLPLSGSLILYYAAFHFFELIKMK